MAGFGGLGGLGDIMNSRGTGNMLQALGMSLMSSPRNAPLANFGQFYGGLQDRQMKLDERDQQRGAIAAALKAWGVPDDEAMVLSANPSAAELRINQLKAEKEKAADNQFNTMLLGVLGGNADTSEATAGGLLSFPGVSDAQAPEIERTPLPAPIQTQFGLRGAAQLDPHNLNVGQTPPDDRVLEPVVNIPQTAQGATPSGNKTLDWLNQNDPEAAKLVDQGFSVRDAFEIAQVRRKTMSAPGNPAAPPTERPAPKASPATALENLAAQRDQLAMILATAPNQSSFQRAKAALDALDTKIEREQGKLSKNQTYQHLSNGFPELADMVRAGALSPKDALSIAMQQQKAGGGVEYGLTPQTGVDASGNPVLIQLGKDGRAVQTAMPEGVSLSKEPIKLDAGTHFVLLDPITRQPVGTIPKENYQESFDKAAGGAAGKSQAEAAASLPGDILAAEQTADQIDQLIQHPGLSSIVGPLDQYRPGLLLGDAGRDALARYNQLQGRAFLQAYGMLKGGGQITEIEGVKAERAMARMDRAQGEKEFKDALTDFRDAVREGLAKLREKAGAGATAPADPAASYKSKYGLE